jgi:hypothetical protein
VIAQGGKEIKNLKQIYDIIQGTPTPMQYKSVQLQALKKDGKQTK